MVLWFTQGVRLRSGGKGWRLEVGGCRKLVLRRFSPAVLRSCGVAVEKGKEVRGLRLEAEGEISNVKVQMTNGNELVG